MAGCRRNVRLHKGFYRVVSGLYRGHGCYPKKGESNGEGNGQRNGTWGYTLPGGYTVCMAVYTLA